MCIRDRHANDLYLKWSLESPNEAYQNPVYILYNRESFLNGKYKNHKYHSFLIKWFDEDDICYIEKTWGTRKEHKEHMGKYFRESEKEMLQDVVNQKYGKFIS